MPYLLYCKKRYVALFTLWFEKKVTKVTLFSPVVLCHLLSLRSFSLFGTNGAEGGNNP